MRYIQLHFFVTEQTLELREMALKKNLTASVGLSVGATVTGAPVGPGVGASVMGYAA